MFNKSAALVVLAVATFAAGCGQNAPSSIQLKTKTATASSQSVEGLRAELKAWSVVSFASLADQSSIKVSSCGLFNFGIINITADLMDTNPHDGHISGREWTEAWTSDYAVRKCQQQIRTYYNEADVNRDDVIDRGELRYAKVTGGSFLLPDDIKSGDKNQDGKLDASEFEDVFLKVAFDNLKPGNFYKSL